MTTWPTPSRHLGLIPAAERRPEAVATVERLGALVADACDLRGLVALAHTAAPLTAAPWDAAAVERPPRTGARIAIAGGPAFTFGYAENDELLAAAGAEVVRFDPLRDTALPEGTGGIVIGGGFPETYAAELSANEPLRREPSRRSAGRSTPSAPGCCTSPGGSTTPRCAASSTPRRG